jgi:hypothetical protein
MDAPVDPRALDSFGRALRACFEGDITAELTIHRDDGRKIPLPVAWFFREPSAFTPIETAAIERCAGRVLDVGAGTGLHALVLQEKGLGVTAIDISSQAAHIMEQRGITNVHCMDVFDFQGGRFDTLLMLGHGIGMVETITGLDRFLAHARYLLVDRGQLLLDSLDVRITDDSGNLAYHEANRKAGRYIGETRMAFEFNGTMGPVCGWLHVDPNTLAEHAESAGWQTEILHRLASGDYLARLVRGETT